MPSISVAIRPVRREDAADLQANCFSRNTVEELRRQIDSLLDAFRRGQALRLVADAGGTVVGSADLTRETHRMMQHRADWGGVVVSGDYQGRGIARALLQETLTLAAAWGIELLTVGVRGGTPAEEVYRRLGFQEYARLPGGLKEERDGKVLVFDEAMLYIPVAKHADPS
jgi:ribosomal protein S18 acetylase RimI-like enzyme